MICENSLRGLGVEELSPQELENACAQASRGSDSQCGQRDDIVLVSIVGIRRMICKYSWRNCTTAGILVRSQACYSHW